MKLLESTLCVLALIPMLAAGPGYAGPGDDDQVSLQSQDGQDFEVEVKVAKKSETIKNLIEDAGVDAPIRLPNIAGKTLAKIVEFMKYATERPFDTDRALFVYLRGLLNEKDVSTAELLDMVKAANYLDVRSQREGDALTAVLKLYGDRIFGHIELENLKSTTAASYATYAKAKLSLPRDLQKIIVRQSLLSIDRVFLDTTPKRRINAVDATPLDVAQIIAYIAKNQTPNAAGLPEHLRNVLVQWQGTDFASKIHFGPWPTEFATWPGHCPLASDENYNMYSDNTPKDRFVDNSDGTVTDVYTLLTWQQASSEPMNWQSAKSYCAELNRQEDSEHGTKKRKTEQESESNASQLAWRAPTRIELQSIVNYAATNPALNPIFHEGNARYWSSTPAVGHENQAWIVSFAQGYVAAQRIADNSRMRCVRGERGGPESVGAKNHYTYTPRGETVTDNFTGALWQRRVIDEGRNHAAAVAYCTNLDLEGRGWNLPTVKILSTLIDVNVGAPRIDRQAFPATPERWFWSSSPRVGYPSIAWGVNFNIGYVSDFLVDVVNRARCVR